MLPTPTKLEGNCVNINAVTFTSGFLYSYLLCKNPDIRNIQKYNFYLFLFVCGCVCGTWCLSFREEYGI
jgi:hypothetical protein